MTLLRLRYFIAVATRLHFGRAAKRLMVTQPSLSRQITLLEEEVGVPLLLRDTRRVALTNAGREYLDQAREILRGVSNAAASARRAERGESGRLSVAFYYIAELGILPPVLRRFRQRYPNVFLELRELPSRSQIAEVLKSTVDVGIVHEPSTAGTLCVETVQREAMVAALRVQAGSASGYHDPVFPRDWRRTCKTRFESVRRRSRYRRRYSLRSRARKHSERPRARTRSG